MTLPFPFLLNRVFNVPLLVVPARLDAFIIGLEALLAPRELSPARLAFSDEEPSETVPRRSPGYTINNGVALLPIHGVLVRRAGQMAPDCTPLMSYETISRRLRGAMNDTRVRAVMLDLDTPGGEAGGVLDLAREIRGAAQIKPIWAHANDDAFSAGYAIASGAERIWSTRSGGVGSIGVVALHSDQSQYDAKEGLRYSYIHAGKRKIDGNPHEPLSDEARRNIKAEVDRLHGMFIETVAGHRGLTHEAVADTDAGLFFGHEAIVSRLADQVGTPDEAHAALAQRVAPTARRAAMTERPEPTAELTADTLNQMQTEVAAVAEDRNVYTFNAGRQQGADRAIEIVEMCIAAGRAQLGTQLARSDMSIDQVRRHLLDLAASEAARPLIPIATEGPAQQGPPLPAPISSRESFAPLMRRNN